MPLDPSLFGGINLDPPKEEATTVARAPQAPTAVDQGPKETGTSYVVRKGTSGVGEAFGRNLSAGSMIGLEGMPMAALRLFLPKDIVDYISPAANLPVEVKERSLSDVVKGKGGNLKLKDVVTDYAEEGKKIGALAGSRIVNAMGGSAPYEEKIGAAPGAISKNLGGVANVVGQTLAQPMGGAIPRQLAMAAGVGELGELGGEAAGSLARNMGASEKTTAMAEAGGNFAGGFAGGPLNLLRIKAMDAIGRPIVGSAVDTAKAAKSAFTQYREDNSRGFLSYFMDDYSHLRDNAVSSMEKTIAGKVANEIRLQGPDAPLNAQKWAESVEKAGLTPTEAAKFPLGVQTVTPNLIATSNEIARTPAEKRGMGNAIMEAAKRIIGAKPSDSSLLAQMEEFQKRQQLRIDGLNAEGQAIRATTPGMSVVDEAKQGEQLRSLYEQELAAGRAEKDRHYDVAKDLADKQGLDFDPKEVSQRIKGILNQTFSSLDPSTVPESIIKVRALLKQKNLDPTVSAIVDASGRAIETAPAQVKPLRLRDVNDAIVALNDDIRSANRASTTNTSEKVKANNLRQVRESLEEMITKQASPEVIGAYNDAIAHFRGTFVPRFQTGANANLGREAGAARTNQELVPNESVMGSYLKKPPGTDRVGVTQMEEFDNLFGGKLDGTKRVDAAYDALWTKLENDYNKDVLSKGAFKQEAHDKFLYENEAPLNALPGLRDKLDQNASKLSSLQAEAERAHQYFKDVTQGPLARTLGPEDAQKTLAIALTDPRKMGQLTAALGPEGSKALAKEIMLGLTPWKENLSGGLDYAPEKLIDVLNKGLGRDGAPGGLSTAFRAAYGQKEGDLHLDRLRALAILAEREALSNPATARALQGLGPESVANATGTTGASFLSQLKAYWEGRQSGTHFAAVGIGRYLNTEIQKNVAEAMQKALYDPKMSKAILEAAQTAGGDKLSRGAADMIFGTGKAGQELVKRMIDYGMIRRNIAQSTRIAITDTANRDKTDPSNQERVPKSYPPLEMGTMYIKQ